MSSPTTLDRRPTILLGYGAFGLDVLQRFLADASLRGVLTWEEPAGGAGPSERKLEQLELLWVPDSDETETAEDAVTHTPQASLEIMRDLYRQIRPLPSSPTHRERRREAVTQAAARLLDTDRRAARGSEDDLPPGLDVMVVAHPDDPGDFGALDDVLQPLVRHLGGHPNLQRAVSGTSPLSFLEILDFDDYWARTPEARRLREALYNSVRRWRQEADRGRPTVGRMYLVDGPTEGGRRDAGQRRDEISLFLELLLFEGQRARFQSLYRPAHPGASPVATFGARLLERGTSRLSRLAAARFGAQWLDHLLGDETGSSEGAEAPELTRVLDAYRPDALDDLLGGDELHGRLDDELDDLERELLALSPRWDDWGARVEERCEQRVGDILDTLSQDAGRRMMEIRQNRLSGLSSEIRRAVEADLHRSEEPCTSLSAAHRELTALLDALDARDAQARREARDSDEVESGAGGWSRFHRRFRAFRDSRVDPTRLRSFWPLFAVILAAGLTPLTVDGLQEIALFLSPSDPAAASRWSLLLHDLLDHIAHPALVGVLWVGLGLVVGEWGVHRPLTRRTERALDFFHDEERGRFPDKIRAALAPGGAIRRHLEHHVDTLWNDMARTVRSEVRREVAILGRRLRERRREMQWLAAQLRELLKVHGVHGSADGASKDTAVRRVVHRDGDLEQVMQSQPATEARFRSARASEPFHGWDDTFYDGFLFPLAFLETWSRAYRDPFLDELRHADSGPEQEAWAEELLDFVRQYGRRLHPAFSLRQREGVPNRERFCVLPKVWQGLPGARATLEEQRFGGERLLPGVDVSRAYLLVLQTGIDPETLLGDSP